MELIILGAVLAIAGIALFLRLRESEVDDNVLKARLHHANEFYQAIRHETSNERWVINKARNDVYFRRLDVRFKSWNPTFRRAMYWLSAILVLSGSGLIVLMFFQYGVFK